MKRIILTIVVFIIAIAGIAYILTNNKKENKEKSELASADNGFVIVKAIHVEPTSINLDFSANGNFTAMQDLRLKAESSGRITRILAKEGDYVTKGQLLAIVDADYANLDAQNAKSAVQKLENDYQRYKNAYESGGVTKAQLDEIAFNLKTAKLQVQQTSRRQSDANVRAPFNGVINLKLIDVGAYMSPGIELFEIVDVSKLKLSVGVVEAQVVSLKKGDRVKVTSTVFPNQEFYGNITFIAPKADNSLNYPVEITLNNNNSNDLKAGMYGTANFEFPKEEGKILIPRTAFVGGVNSNTIFLIDGQNKAVQHKIVAGRILGDNVEVVSGLNAGDKVVTSGQINLINGTPLQPQFTK